jgi:TorA maturation chaperone TorD
MAGYIASETIPYPSIYLSRNAGCSIIQGIRNIMSEAGKSMNTNNNHNKPALDG